MTVELGCSMCLLEADDIKHIFFECPVAIQTWALSYLHNQIMNLAQHVGIGWLHENAQISDTTIDFSATSDEIKFNFDVAWSTITRKCGLGVVVQNGDGTLVAAASEGIMKVSSPEQAELLAAKLVVQLGIELQLKGFVLESDANGVINKLQRDGKSFSLIGTLVEDVRTGLGLLDVKEVTWVRSYYSTYGHVEKLAHEIKKGADSVEGVEAKLWQVPETLSEEILGKMGAPPKSGVPVITPDELPEADAFIFGFPTRFGMMAAQFKAFLDATGGLWKAQKLAGKPAGLFYSTGSQGGGQETTPLTAITQLVHHGMIFVPIGCSAGSVMFEMGQVKGGSPYGAGTYAGDGSRQPTEIELQIAFHQGKYIAGIAKKFKGST
ncbi:hypothetical protein ACH5RR_017736 [Cinchona calisaya]|uniref:NAD(P)H dehydrogenase (quinone) n=1 Tax=Cinchona calisaya TaxID=153742 RepID=A0ABD2ZN74_9GENT